MHGGFTNIKRMREGKKVIIHGDGSSLWTLTHHRDFAVGLVTGNIEEGARIKVEMAGLAKFFHFGGYGSDSEDRTTLIEESIRRGTQFVFPAPVESVFVVGDTPLDIIHGHRAGARAIAVASAGFSLGDLEPYKPDLLVPSLTPSDPIISFMRS